MIVPRIEGEPTTIKEHLVQCAEVHGSRIGGNADVAKVARAVPRGDVHASGKRHGKMSEVSADAAAFLVPLRGGTVRPRVMVSEFDAVVDVVTDRLRSLPAALSSAKERPCQVRQFFGVAVATGQQEGKNVTGQFGYVPLLRRRAHLIRQAAVLYDEFAANFQQPGWGDQPGADVAIRI